MSVVAGLDLSLTRAGIALLRDGRPLKFADVGHGSPDGKSYMHRFRRVWSQEVAVTNVLAPHKDEIDLIVIEMPLMHGKHLGYPFDRFALINDVARRLAGVGWKLPIAFVHNQTAKVWATGKGSSGKSEEDKKLMLATVRGWYGPRVLNHDQADAISLATAGAFHLGDPMPFPIKDQHHHRLEKVEWPKGLVRA